MTQAILFVGHGTRNPTGQQQFLSLAGALRAAVAPTPLEVAYIEIQAPLIEEALISLYDSGLKSVALSPALLFAAGHAKRDIPAAIAAAEAKSPGLQVKVAEPLGCHEAILELAAIRFSHSLSSAPRGEGRGEGAAPQIDSPSSTALVVVGRGGSDPTALAHCQEFAQQLAQRVGIEHVYTGFIAIAQPNLPAALALAAASGAKQVVVQPHLLFEGEMLNSTSQVVATFRKTHPQIDWRQAAVLGSDLLEKQNAAADLIGRALLARWESLNRAI